ncbi:MAG: hypothetical protein ABH854_03210 [Candidatus Diapherotrites archaeon]|nr:hypothetical protein [Candidatus Micrarchaeota archaeon]MBU1939768.1 hypothetical protein [Candidatus Micrarchaeota archaeon]
MTKSTENDLRGLQVKDAYLKKLGKIEDGHFRKYGYRGMSERTRKRLFGKLG